MTARVNKDHAGRRADRAGDLPRHRRRRARSRARARASTLTPLYNSDDVLLAAGLRRGLDRGAVASSASTASRCWPRRTRSRRAARSAGRWSPRCSLAGVLFIVQTWVAALLVPDPARPDRQGRPRRAPRSTTPPRSPAAPGWPMLPRGRHRDRLGLRQLAGRAGRHLPAAVRDGPRPAAARRSSPRCTRRTGVPVNATLLVAAVSLVARPVHGQRATTASRCCRTLVNFGALTAFLVLHVSVVVHYVVRHGSRDWWRHLVVPVIGFAILLLRGDQREGRRADARLRLARPSALVLWCSCWPPAGARSWPARRRAPPAHRPRNAP